MQFTCIGFDARVFPCKDNLSVDWSEWERDIKCYEKVTNIWGVNENEYGLLDIKDQAQRAEIEKYILTNHNQSDLVAIEFPTKVVEFLDSKWGYHTASRAIDLSNYLCLGMDICDLEGLWTIFNHPEMEPYREASGLLSEFHIMDALELVQFANVIEPSHRPSVVAKIYSLRYGGKV